VRRTPAFVAATVLLLVATACGVDGEPEARKPSGEETSQKGSAQCHDLLDKAEGAKLMAGEVLDPTDTLIGGLEACKWDGVTDPGASVTVVRTPAGTWAERLPALFDQLERTGGLQGRDKQAIERARALIKEPRALTGDEACAIFTTMVVEFFDQPAGSTRVINWVPDRKAPQAVNVQTCEEGTYTSLQLLAGGLQGSAEEEQRLKDAYDALAPLNGTS